MNEWTPGPWVVAGTEIHDRKTFYDDDGSRIGDTAERIAKIDIHGVAGQREANARLIAAAPAMYEALVRLHKLIEQFGLNHPDDGSEWWPVLDDAEAALAKANGETT